MSVGLSQVNFDAQALEDEEEAAFEKEDQEREKELRELISNELDDDLLDDNASFSSHDFRSSSRGQNTPSAEFPPDSPRQQWSGQWSLPSDNGTAFLQYPARIPGGFERPPLVTPKGFQLLKGSGLDSEHEEEPGNSAENCQYYDEEDGQIRQDHEEYFHRQSQGKDHHIATGDYDQNSDYVAGGQNIDFRNYNETGHPSAFQSYEPRSRFDPQYYNTGLGRGHTDDMKDQSGSEYGDNEMPPGLQTVQGRTTEYVGYHGDHKEAMDNSEKHLGHLELGEHRVQYLRRQLPTGSAIPQGEGVTKDHSREDQIQSNNGQLEILYRARGRKIEELSQELEEKKDEFGRQIRMLNHQLALVKGEHGGMAASLEQAQLMVTDKNNEMNDLKSKLVTAVQQGETAHWEKEEALQKLQAAESAVESLNQQLVELSRSETLTRAKEQNDSLLDAIRRKHEEELLKLRQRLDEKAVSLDWKTEEANRLRDELGQSRRETDSARLDRAETINQLTKSLEESQNQCQQLLQKVSSGTTQEVAQLRVQLQEAFNAQNRAESQCKALQAELVEVKEQLQTYEKAMKLGVASNELSDPLVRNLHKENWATPKTSTPNETEKAVFGLRKELESCLSSNIAKRDQVRRLETELHQVSQRLEDEQERSQKMEKVAREREDQILELNQKLEQVQSREHNPDEEYQVALREMEEMKQGFLEFEQKLEDAEKYNEQLQGENADLRRQMTEMVAEFDEDKRISIDKCRESVLQLHEDTSKLLREKLQEEHREQMDAVRQELETNNEELIRVKECYVQLCQETRELEQRVRDECSKETQELLKKNESEALQHLRQSLEKEHAAELEKMKREVAAQKENEIQVAVEKHVAALREDIQEEQEEKTEKAIEEALTAARDKWRQDTDEQATRDWVNGQEREKQNEFETRLTSAMDQAKSRWEREHAEGVHKAVEEARVEWEKSHAESSTQETERAIELAMSQAKADWLKHEEELRQREIEQAVEVAITNAVAEARQKWDKEIQLKEISSQTQLMRERMLWKKEEEEQRQKSIETAVAIAEVKWLEQEQVKRRQAVDQALATVRETWQQEKQRDIELAVENITRELAALHERESKVAVEAASKKLTSQMKEENEKALKKAVEQAKMEWQHDRDANNNKTGNVDVESVKEELWSEFEQFKEMEIQQAVEEARNLGREETELQKQAAINKAIHYLEDQYARGLEEFKHKELREALSQARRQWEEEEDKEMEERLQKRVATAREDWQKDQTQLTQAEIDRALTTAREAWAANHQDELEEQLIKATERVRKDMKERMANEKQQLAESVRKLAAKQFEKEKLHFENELQESKEQIAHLEKDIQSLVQSTEKEVEERSQNAREQLVAEHDRKVEQAVEEAKKQWEEEQEEERIQLEEQYQQKIKLTVESARRGWNKDHAKAVKAACDEAVKKQFELWTNERRSNQSVISRLKEDAIRMEKEHASALEKLRKDFVEEKRRIKQGQYRRNSGDNSSQSPGFAESENDSSFSSMDQVAAAQGLNELRQHYLDTVARIREDVMDHVNQTKANAAKKIRSEVLKERHLTAKKLRKYYLQCLKQLLEEDRAALSKNNTASSDETKIERMANALKTPDSLEKTGQHSQQEADVSERDPLGARHTHYSRIKSSHLVDEQRSSKNSPAAGIGRRALGEFTPQSKPHICSVSDRRVNDSSDNDSSDNCLRDTLTRSVNNDVRNTLEKAACTTQQTFVRKSKSLDRNPHFLDSRPKAYSPEGESDPAALGPRRAEKAGVRLMNHTSETPLKRQGARRQHSNSDKTFSKESSTAVNPKDNPFIYERKVDVTKRIENESSPESSVLLLGDPHGVENIAEQDAHVIKRVVAQGEVLQRGHGPGRVQAPSPACSAVSYESEQYSELPTVIHLSPGKNLVCSPTSANGRSSQYTRGPCSTSSTRNGVVTKPVLHALREKSSTGARRGRLKSREQPTLPSSPLPSKPSITINSVTGRTS